MMVFWIVAALMTATAVAFVLVPLLRPRPLAGPSVNEANLEVLRSQRREIEADVANGTLPAEARAEALQELVGRAEEDLGRPETPVAAPRRPWVIAAIAGVAVPVLAFGLYLAVGNPAAMDPALAAHNAAPASDQQIIAMVEALAQKVRERPDDAQGWSLLARSMAALGRFQESVDAYEHLLKIAPPDANMLADYADALGMAQGQSLKGRPTDLVRQALALDPANRKALALAGTAALDANDFPEAIKYWTALAAQVPAGSPDAAQVQAVIAEVRQKAAAAGKPLPDTPVQFAKAPAGAPPITEAATVVAKAPADPAKSVTGSVSLAPGIAAKVSGNETLFIFARAESGSRMPLAILRATARELPMKFALDDSSSMNGVNLSSAEAVRVEARISRSGTATPQSGDLIGTSAVVKPGARDVEIVVDKVVP